MSQHTSLIPVFTGTLQDTEVQMCDARKLHKFLGVGRNFNSWITGRIAKYGFVKGTDYTTFKVRDYAKRGKRNGGRPRIEFTLSLHTAEELAITENNAKGLELRRYFRECRKRFLSGQTKTQPYTNLHTPREQTLSAEQADQLRNTLQEAAEKLQEEHRRKFLIQAWSKLKAHFRVEYRKIPSQHFTDALSIIARHCAEASHEQGPAKAERIFISTVTPDGMVSRELSDDEVLVNKGSLAAWVADESHHLTDKQLAEITQACAFRVASELLK